MNDSEYISRDAVDAKLLAMKERVIDNPFALTAIAMVMNEIDKITAADVAPVVHGHWGDEISVREHDDVNGGYFITCVVPCSNCGYEIAARNKTKFCPNCGAKMDESEDNDIGRT